MRMIGHLYTIMKKDQDITSTDPTEIESLIARIKQGSLQESDTQLLERLLRLLLSLIQVVQHKNASIARLKRMLFGPRTDARTLSSPQPDESTTDKEAACGDAPAQSSSAPTSSSTGGVNDSQRKRTGHGRRKASGYTGAEIVQCADPELKAGDRCPHCAGHLYDTNAPSIFIRLTGHAIVGATRYEQQVLRCSGCQMRLTAPLPEGLSPVKYDPSADVAMAEACVWGRHSLLPLRADARGVWRPPARVGSV